MASLFATQQRWLMAHAALARYFRNEADETGAGLLAERFLELVERHGLASRNTASAFLKEMLKYEIVRFVADSEGRRHRPVEPAPAVLMALFHWHAVASCDPRWIGWRRQGGSFPRAACIARRRSSP